MSIAMERVGAYGGMFPADPQSERKIFGGEDLECWSSSSTSSIGRNSDEEDDENSSDGGENEADSSSKEGPLDMMESLEEVLPIRRGLSMFYNGKSKSFTSLAEASSSSSIKDITKPENAYARRRRNLLNHNLWDKSRTNFSIRSNSCGISKRPISSSRSTLALAMAVNSSGCSSSSSSEDSLSGLSPTRPLLPPLHPQTKGYYGNSASPMEFYPWRSYSVADLPRCSGVVAGGGGSGVTSGDHGD